ncbi:hypothetical protein ACFY2K_42315 [Kitasatospora sp. NPDC001309]|uniref:hypothetical protein n=1 Tax=Kitasatospora sp. NPDC001309 TaxID=3364013 RepID=UPI0036C350A3
MLATLRTTTAPTVTGRSYARRVASLTSGSHRVSAGKWVAEAQGDERRRRAAACRLGRLTGRRAPRWTGEIGTRDWRTILAAGAEALAESAAAQPAAEAEPAKCAECGTRLNRANRGTVCSPCQASASAEPVEAPAEKRHSGPDMKHLDDTAREFARVSTRSTSDRVVDQTRNGRVEALVAELLAAQPASALDLVGEDERKSVERWSPFRNGPRHVVRCADGSRRYGTGELAPEH